MIHTTKVHSWVFSQVYSQPLAVLLLWRLRRQLTLLGRLAQLTDFASQRRSHTRFTLFFYGGEGWLQTFFLEEVVCWIAREIGFLCGYIHVFDGSNVVSGEVAQLFGLKNVLSVVIVFRICYELEQVFWGESHVVTQVDFLIRRIMCRLNQQNVVLKGHSMLDYCIHFLLFLFLLLLKRIRLIHWASHSAFRVIWLWENWRSIARLLLGFRICIISTFFIGVYWFQSYFLRLKFIQSPFVNPI